MLLFFFLLAAIHVSGTTLQQNDTNKFFYLKETTSYGPQRLSGVRPAPSLIYCITSCLSSFTDKCLSVIYNFQTQLCTPGYWLEPNQPLPRSEEGQLYISYQCDPAQGFIIYTYGDTKACVFYDLTKKNYTEAESDCQALNSTLYIINNVDKFYMLQAIFKQHLWIGLNDIEKEGTYVWSDGKVNDMNSTSFMFQKGEPNNYNGAEDCIAMPLASPLRLNDDSCNKSYSYVCEKPL